MAQQESGELKKTDKTTGLSAKNPAEPGFDPIEYARGLRAAEEEDNHSALMQQVDSREIVEALPNDQLAFLQAQQQRHILKTGPYTEAVDTVRRWLEVHRAARVPEPAPSPTPQTSSSALITTPQPNGALIGTDVAQLSTTPLEDMRREAGLHIEREQIYRELTERMDLREGMRMLDRWTRTYASRYCRSMSHVHQLFPSLTSTEISLLPLLTEVPESFVTESTGYDSLAALRRKHGEGYKAGLGLSSSNFQEIPQQFEMRVDGIAFGTDSTNLRPILNPRLNPGDKQIVAFHPEIDPLISRLVVLTVEGPRLFERVREETTDALTVGVGLIQREALNQTARSTAESPDSDAKAVTTALTSSQADEPESFRVLREAISELDQTHSEAFKGAEQQVASALIEAKLSYSDGRAVGFPDLVHLIGLLEQIPPILLQPEPFEGNVHFYGDRVLFTSNDGIIRDECLLDDQCRTLLGESIVHEVMESTDLNRTMLEIQRNLTARTQTKLFRSIVTGTPTPEEKSQVLSLLEAIALDVHRRHGIAFHVIGEHSIASMNESSTEYMRDALVADDTVKFGFHEANQLANLLDRIPAELRPGIRALEKKQCDLPEEKALANRQIGDVSYNPENGTVTLYESVCFPYSAIGEAGRLERSFLLASACGEALWSTLDNGQKRKWGMFFRAAAQPGDIKLQLATAESESDLVVLAGEALRSSKGPHLSNCLSPQGMRSAQAKFCSSFACFVLANEEFEAAGESNRVIRDMYRNLESLIADRTGDAADFRAGALPLSKVTSAFSAEFPHIIKESKDLMQALMDEFEESTRNPHSPLATDAKDRTDEDIENEMLEHDTDGDLTERQYREKIDREELESELESIMSALFQGLHDTDRFNDFVLEIANILERDDGEDTYDQIENLVECLPALENDVDEPLDEIWNVLVDYGLVTDFE